MADLHRPHKNTFFGKPPTRTCLIVWVRPEAVMPRPLRASGCRAFIAYGPATTGMTQGIRYCWMATSMLDKAA
jgi:hypothetical protein